MSHTTQTTTANAQGAEVVAQAQRNSAQYNERFNGWQIRCMQEAGVSPELSKKFDKRFNGFGIAEMHKAGVKAKEANQYDKRFNSVNIIIMSNRR